MSPKLYIYFAIFVLTIGFIKWAHYSVDIGGYNRAIAEMSAKKDDAETEGQADVETVIEYRDRVKVEYRDRIKEIYLTKGNESCLDATYTSLGL